MILGPGGCAGPDAPAAGLAGAAAHTSPGSRSVEGLHGHVIVVVGEGRHTATSVQVAGATATRLTLKKTQ